MEIWKAVPGYVGYYEVSNCGSVRSVDRTIVRSDGVVQMRTGKTKETRADKDGYTVVKLSKDGVDKIYGVHRLVYSAFRGVIPDGYEVDHIDFDRSNNHLDNLRVLTKSENIARTIDCGRHVSRTTSYNGSNNPNYGNHVLSERYKSDPLLAVQKQSRSGGKNGRAKPIMMIDRDGVVSRFSFIRECARTLIDGGCVHSNSLEVVATNISSALHMGKSYAGYRFVEC